MAMAVLATLRWWSGANIDRFLFHDEIWLREPCGVAPTLFHVDLIHLIFNVYWLWVFGSQVEQTFGSGRTLGIYLLFAIGSGMAQVAFLAGGVDLSGVGYGLFGLLWILSPKDPRFWNVVDRPTVQLFIGWFFLCIALTAAGVWNVANVAHGARLDPRNVARLDDCRPWRWPTLTRRDPCRSLFTLHRRRNYRTSLRELVEKLCRGVGLRGLSGPGRRQNATRRFLYERAVAIDPQANSWWHNLGVAYSRGEYKRPKPHWIAPLPRRKNSVGSRQPK